MNDAAKFSGEVAPVAEVFPLLRGAELAELVASIEQQGLLHPIVLQQDGALLDGRNRLQACEAAGVEPRFVTYAGGDPVGFVVAANLARRHLSESQRAVVAARLTTTSRDKSKARRQAHDRGSEQICPLQQVVTRGDAAALLNVSERSINTARRVLDEAPSLAPAIDSGELAVSAAADVARYAPDTVPLIAEGSLTPSDAAAEARTRKAHVAHNTGENEWYTPAPLIEAARAAMGSIDTDPASSDTAQTLVQAGKYHTIETNGLAHDWHGNVWMNPPYAQPLIGQFTQHLVEQVRAGNVTQAVVLVNNATETRWAQDLLEAADAVCFLRGRVRYLDQTLTPAKTPLQGQMLVYTGATPDAFREATAKLGTVYVRG